MKNGARLFAAGVLCFLAAVAVQAQSQAQAQPLEQNSSERELFDLLNRERAANRLPELHWDDALFRAARKHALLMLNLNSLEHQLPGEPSLEERFTAAGARFTYIAENIGIGRDPDMIHSAWMDSAGHRKNILSPQVTAVGIAAVRGSGGLYTVEDFSQSFSDLTLEQQEKQVAALLAGRGLHISSGSQEARKECNRGSAGPTSRTGSIMTSWSVVRFETPDLSELPADVDKKIRSLPFHNLAVGACPLSEGAGFGRYKIALLFF